MTTPSFDIDAYITTSPTASRMTPSGIFSQPHTLSTPGLHSRAMNASGYPFEESLLDPSGGEFMQQTASYGSVATADWVASTFDAPVPAATPIAAGQLFGSPVFPSGSSVQPTFTANTPAASSSSAVPTPLLAPSAVTAPLSSASATELNRVLYKQSIVAHHGQLLQARAAQALAHAHPARAQALGRPGVSAGGSRSMPVVPRTQAATTARFKDMSLQERRRMSRQLLRQKGGSSAPKSKVDAKRNAIRTEVEGNSNKTIGKPSIGLEHGGAMQTYMGLTVNAGERPSLCQDDLVYQGIFPHTGRPLIRGSGGSYSTSGFDIFDILTRVVQRPNPRITIGPVDFSCSFTVVSALDPEQPIIYASDTFCHLTGYQQREIIGRNCRFLQGPGGDVEAGGVRAYTDMGAVAHFKKHLAINSECQASLINYRKDGQPFINLVTIVPIPARDSSETEFFVGFQVDLVEQPHAIIERAEDGTCVVNYSSPPKDEMDIDEEEPEDTTSAEYQLGKQTIMAHELGETIGRGTNEARQWARLLLDNSHDLIYVLSLKGIFLYVSPSVKRLLGFSADELVGRSISEFCHPSDVVPVFRELKDSTNNSSIASATRRPWRHESGTNGPVVNLMMRMRHSSGHYIWIESSGKLHLEQGKGRKVIVSSARQRPINDLAWDPVRRTNEIRQPSFWSKISTDGLILSSTTPVLNVLGKTAHSMSGLHLAEMTQPKSIPDLLEALQTTKVTSVQHALADHAGLAVPVISTFFPALEQVCTVTTKFVWSRLLDSDEKRPCDLDFTEVKHPARAKDDGEATVFEELSTSRTSSWVFELHQLQNANRRLREEVRSMNNRTRVALQELEPSQPGVKRASHSRKSSVSVNRNAKDAPSNAAKASLTKPHWLGTTNATSSSGTDSTASMSTLSTPSLFDKNCSGSDELSATSVSSGGEQSQRSGSSDGSGQEQVLEVPKRGLKRKA